MFLILIIFKIDTNIFTEYKKICFHINLEHIQLIRNSKHLKKRKKTCNKYLRCLICISYSGRVLSYHFLLHNFAFLHAAHLYLRVQYACHTAAHCHVRRQASTHRLQEATTAAKNCQAAGDNTC